MKKRITLHRVIVILFSITIFVNVMGGAIRPLFISMLSDLFGPPRSELVELSKFAHLTTTCFDDKTITSCEYVTLEEVRERIQPELDKHELIFVDYFFHDEIRFGTLNEESDYEIPKNIRYLNPILVEYHVVLAKNGDNQYSIVYIPYEIIKDSNIYIYTHPYDVSLNYEAMLVFLESQLGDFIIFNYEFPNGSQHTFKVVLSDMIFTLHKPLYHHFYEIVIIHTNTNLYIEVDGNWIPYTSSYENSIAVKIVYDKWRLTIYNTDEFITDPEILFEYLSPGVTG